MTDLRLGKIFAWVIGVLVLLWLLAECVGASGPVYDPDQVDREQDAQSYAADCDRTWRALDLMGQVDAANVDDVVDEIDMLASEITDPELARLTSSFAVQAREIVDYADPEDPDAFQDDYQLYRGLIEADLTMRCTSSGRFD